MNPRELVSKATLLANEGAELVDGIWESCVYLGSDGFVYHINAEAGRREPVIRISGKRAIGEYLRWTDGLFRPGELPGAASGVHYRAARRLRELV
jgi:hypothetical protein